MHETIDCTEGQPQRRGDVSPHMLTDSFKPQRKVVLAAVTAVTATYTYFLIFAQFGFLKAVLDAGAEAPPVRALMTVMGVAGMAAAAATARWAKLATLRAWLVGGFAACALAAALALAPQVPVIFFAVALLVGLGLGVVTVALACVLRPALGGAHLGTVIGLGTGLAYGFCNLPPVFAASAAAQAGVAVAAALAGILAVRQLVLKATTEKPAGYDYSRQGMLVWVLVFFGLVALDSAAFYIIQHSGTLAQTGWSAAGGLYVNAAVHLIAALLAGYALDQRWVGRTIFVGAAALLLASWLLAPGQQAFALGTILYTAGVSVYSTVLVFYPARGLRPWLVAAVYGVGGWFGSGVGIGLAQERTSLPVWIIGVAAVWVLGLLAWRGRGHETQQRAFRG